MDKIDKKIITFLQQNARMPLKALAENVFLSSPAVSARIERLEKEEIIEGYEVKINQLKLGYHITAFINLEVAPVQKPDFYPFIKSCPNVVECKKSEQRPSKPWVEGSNPPGHTFFYESWPVAYDFCIMVGIAQLVSASDCGSEGPGFESLYPPFFYFLGYRQAVRHRVLIPALRWFESS